MTSSLIFFEYREYRTYIVQNFSCVHQQDANSRISNNTIVMLIIILFQSLSS